MVGLSALLRRTYVPPLRKTHLRSLGEYKNQGEDRSFTYRYVLSPMYNRLIHFVPIWIAPNLITLIGFLIAISGHIVAVFQPTPMGSVAAAFGQLLYMILDNLDGRQARRTGSSSPLGHLFDHGCDAMNVSLAAHSLGSVLQLPAIELWLLVFISQLSLLTSSVEEYATGAMILHEINGPNEGILVLVSSHLLVAYYGANAWNTSTSIGITYSQIGIIVNAIATFGTMYAAFRRFNRNSISSIIVATPHLLYGLMFAAWYQVSPNSFASHCRTGLWTSAFFTFDVVSRITVSHLTNDHTLAKRAPKTLGAILLLPVYAMLGFRNGPGACLLLCATVALHRALCLIHQLCNHLDVFCLRLHRPGNCVETTSVVPLKNE